MTGACPRCGARYAEATGAVHPYMLASPGCWHAYGEVLAREYQDPALFASSHRFTVDAYAVQHPGDPDDPRACRSVWLHFAALHAMLIDGQSAASATGVMKRLAARTPPPLPAAPSWTVTLADVLAAGEAAHVEATARWARAAHADWAPLLTPQLVGWLA